MSAPKTATVTLPFDTVEILRARVASGGYASEGDVVREGLLALEAQDERIEHWLRTDGVDRYDAWRSTPDDVLTPDEVRYQMDLLAANLRSRSV